MDLVGGVDRDQNRAQLGGGPEGDEPFGDVGCPDGDLAAGLDAHGNQGPGEGVHIITELLIGSGVIQGGVFEGILVGEFLHHAIQNLREGQVDQFVLFPDVLAGAVMVEVEGLLFASGAVEAVHVVDEVGEDDLHLLNVFQPLRLPLQGDEAVIVDRGQGAHKIVNGHGAFADQVVGAGVVGIPQMHMADIGAQIFDGGVAAFAEVPVGMVHVPQDAQLVAGALVQKAAQTGGVGIDAAGLDQQGHVPAPGFLQQDSQVLPNLRLIIVEGAGADVGNPGVLGHFHQALQPGDCGIAVGQVIGCVEAGDSQLLFVKLTDSGCGLIFVEGTAAVQQGVELGQVIDFDAAEAHIQCQIHHFFPGEIGPATGGKGEVHASSSS